MPIVDNEQAPETPWRPRYRRFALAGKEQGVSCSASYSIIEPGAGAPTHRHDEVDEVIIVLDGTLDMWLGDERCRVGANHTVAIPAGVAHGFVAVGPGPARIYAFLPKAGAAAVTTYLDGESPAAADHR